MKRTRRIGELEVLKNKNDGESRLKNQTEWKRTIRTVQGESDKSVKGQNISSDKQPVWNTGENNNSSGIQNSSYALKYGRLRENDE